MTWYLVKHKDNFTCSGAEWAMTTALDSTQSTCRRKERPADVGILSAFSLLVFLLMYSCLDDLEVLARPLSALWEDVKVGRVMLGGGGDYNRIEFRVVGYCTQDGGEGRVTRREV
jgi:hypothetical protein